MIDVKTAILETYDEADKLLRGYTSRALRGRGSDSNALQLYGQVRERFGVDLYPVSYYEFGRGNGNGKTVADELVERTAFRMGKQQVVQDTNAYASSPSCMTDTSNILAKADAELDHASARENAFRRNVAALITALHLRAGGIELTDEEKRSIVELNDFDSFGRFDTQDPHTNAFLTSIDKSATIREDDQIEG